MIHRLRAVYETLPQGARLILGSAARSLPVALRYGRAYVEERRLIMMTERDHSATRALVNQRLSQVMIASMRSSLSRDRVPRSMRARENWSVDDLCEIPPIDKDALRGRSDEMRDPLVPPRYMRYVTTGGTSGAQVGFWLDKDTSLRDWAYVIAAWERVGFVLDDSRVVLRGVRLGQGSERVLTQYEPIRREMYVSTFDMDANNMPTIMDRIDAFGAEYIHGYPSALETLGRAYRIAGRQPPQTRALLAVSENLLPAQREALAQMFDARVFSLYGMSERTCFAAECEQGSALHVADTYGVVELISTDGRVITEPGIRGEIVATGLISYGMPLIRYRTGDYAAWAEGECACGRVGRRLQQIEGRREREFLVSRNQHRIYMTAINMHSPGLDSVARYRFVQERAGEAVLLLEPGFGYTAAIGETILNEIRAKLEGQVNITLDVTDHIPLSPRGKHVFIDQRMPADELP